MERQAEPPHSDLCFLHLAVMEDVREMQEEREDQAAVAVHHQQDPEARGTLTVAEEAAVLAAVEAKALLRMGDQGATMAKMGMRRETHSMETGLLVGGLQPTPAIAVAVAVAEKERPGDQEATVVV